MIQFAIFRHAVGALDERTKLRYAACSDFYTLTIGTTAPRKISHRVRDSLPSRPCTSMRIDAQSALLAAGSKRYLWMEVAGEAARRLRRPALPAELAPIWHRWGHQTVLVRPPRQKPKPTSCCPGKGVLLRRGVVIWLDMTRPDFEGRGSGGSNPA